MYYVKGHDQFAGLIEGETWAFSADQAASHLAIRNGVPKEQKWRLGEFIDNAEVILLQKQAEQLMLF